MSRFPLHSAQSWPQACQHDQWPSSALTAKAELSSELLFPTATLPNLLSCVYACSLKCGPGVNPRTGMDQTYT